MAPQRRLNRERGFRRRTDANKGRREGRNAPSMELSWMFCGFSMWFCAILADLWPRSKQFVQACAARDCARSHFDRLAARSSRASASSRRSTTSPRMLSTARHLTGGASIFALRHIPESSPRTSVTAAASIVTHWERPPLFPHTPLLSLP